MAISWDTYRTIPALLSYAEAKKHHDDVVPIRGDEHKTRPCARRDQKWFSIWEANNAIHVGYGSHAHEGRQKLVTFEPSGTVTVHGRGRGGSAATNERLSKLLGTTFQTHQYDVWVQCSFFDNGEHKCGSLPLRRDVPSTFVRGSEYGLTFVNYKFPVTHRINKPKLKEVLRPMLPFLSYVEGLAKLQERATPTFTAETIAEVYGWADEARRRANPPPSLRWGNEVQQNREEFFRLVASDDHEDRFKAAIMLSYNSYYNSSARETLMEKLMRAKPNDIFDKQEHRDGLLVKDRYRRFMG